MNWPVKSIEGPLSGLRVLELGQYIAAPFAGRLLADLGADVIKVEVPGIGDPMRRWEGGTRPYSPQFAAYNLGKRSIVLDLKSAAGVAALKTLAGDADVLLENFRPGVLDRLGVGSKVLTADNPALVYCGLTGFGADGPYADRPSYDTVISAMSGMYSLLRPADRPSPVGPALSDLLSGMFAVQGILAALHHRGGTGRGQVVDVTMLGSMAGFLTEAITSTLETGSSPQPNTRQRRAQAYGAVAADGKAFVVHLSVPEKFWHALTEAFDTKEWRDDPRFATRADRFEHYDQLDALIKQAAARRPRDEWFALFLERDLPHGPLNTLADLADDPQVGAMGLLTDVPMEEGAPLRTTRPAVEFSDGTATRRCAPPRLGQHTDAVLSALGPDAKETTE